MEKNNPKLFIDTNFFVALYNPSDHLHTKAVTISKALKKRAPVVFISSLVFLETVTVLSQKIGRKSAIAAGKALLKSPNYIRIDPHLEKESWDLFQEIDKKNVSFVDCSTLAVMRFENIPFLLSFDQADFASLQKKYRFSFYNNK